VRHHTYVSDAKLERLYGQMPRKWVSRLAGELQLGPKIMNMSVKSVQPDISRFDRLRWVERSWTSSRRPSPNAGRTQAIHVRMWRVSLSG
jgi:hypothetical protein